MNAESNNDADNAMHREFYSCVTRVSDLPDRIAVAMQRSPGITEAQVRAYYAQYPIGKTDQDGAPCYAQYWRIPKTILSVTHDGQDSLSLSFPQAEPGQPPPPGGLDGLGTRNLDVQGYAGGIPGRYLYASTLNPDGSVRYNPETDILVRDEGAGFDLVIQKRCPDVGGRTVEGIPIDRSEGFRFRSEIECDAPEIFSSLAGVSITTSLDDRLMLSYFISRNNVGNIREINARVKDRIRSFLGAPVELRTITSPFKED